jgi:hypothetical protein
MLIGLSDAPTHLKLYLSSAKLNPVISETCMLYTGTYDDVSEIFLPLRHHAHWLEADAVVQAARR